MVTFSPFVLLILTTKLTSITYINLFDVLSLAGFALIRQADTYSVLSPILSQLFDDILFFYSVLGSVKSLVYIYLLCMPTECSLVK